MSAAVRAERQVRKNGVGWSDLEAELDAWRDAGRTATLWWRDDDAVAPGAPLERLVRLAGAVPVALAVIPAAAEPDLGTWLNDQAPMVQVLQHGWRHANHARAGGKKCEFPAGRPTEAVAAELTAGRDRLAALFGGRALGVLAPPWNRFEAGFLPLLAGCGITGLSLAGARPEAVATPGIARADIHVDLVAWRADRGFIGAGAALDRLVGHLRDRRLGRTDSAEPTGILTHHQVQDDATTAFLHRLLALTAAHSAARWLDAATVFTRS